MQLAGLRWFGDISRRPAAPGERVAPRPAPAPPSSAHGPARRPARGAARGRNAGGRAGGPGGYDLYAGRRPHATGGQARVFGWGLGLTAGARWAVALFAFSRVLCGSGSRSVSRASWSCVCVHTVTRQSSHGIAA